MRYFVADNRPGAWPSILAALENSKRTDQTIIDVAPGTYRTDGLNIFGCVTIRAVQGPGTVILNCSSDYVFSCENTVVLEGLIIHGWGKEALVKASKASLQIRNCELESSGEIAVEGWGGADVTVWQSVVRRGALAFSDCTCRVLASRVEDSPVNGIGVINATQALLGQTVVLRSGGYGIRVSDGSKAQIEDCTVKDSAGPVNICVHNRAEVFIHNTVVEGSNGGLDITDSKATFEGATIRGSKMGMGIEGKSVVEVRAGNVIQSNDIGVVTDAGSSIIGDGLLVENSALADWANLVHDEDSTKVIWMDDTNKPHGFLVIMDENGRVADTSELVFPISEDERRGQVETLLDQLNSMVGLEKVKTQIRGVIDVIRLSQMRIQQGLPSVDATTNLIFLGPPGTGKTTVARLYGQLLAALGVVRIGQVVEVSRKDLVGQHLGETTQKTASKIEEARGGVLFIDEAYALSRQIGTGSDFGIEAIDTLVKEMEDHRDDLVVIAAGYDKEMAEFLDANSGLASRFGVKIHFDPYSVDEMVGILDGFARSAGFYLSPQTLDSVKSTMKDQYSRLSQGNAREVRKLFDSMKQAQASRIMTVAATREVARNELMELLPQDMDVWLGGE